MKRLDTGPLVRTAEEMEESSIHWPYTKVGSVLLFGLSFAALFIVVLAINLCESTGACSSLGSPWCEKVQADKMMGETINTQSNLAFIYVGTIIVFVAIADFYRIYFIKAGKRRNHLVNCPLLTGICGLELCAAGFGSFVYHAHGTALTGFLDLGLACVLLLNLSLYGLLFFVDVYAHWIPLNFLRLAIVVVGMGLGGWIGEESRVENVDSFVAMPAMVGAIAGLGALVLITRLVPATRKAIFPSEQISWRFRASHFAALCTLLCVIALICQEGPVELPCDPSSAWQFHAVWHVGITFGLGSLYLFYRSEFIGFEGDDLSRFVVDDDSGCYDRALSCISVSPPDAKEVHIEL